MQTATQTSREKFLADFDTLNGAAVGVSVVRTREVYRFMETLKDYSYEKGMTFRVWNVLSGWNTYKLDDETAAPTADNNPAIMGALQAILADGQKPKPGTAPTPGALPANDKGFLYAMMWPHKFCQQGDAGPPIIQQLAEYSKVFSEQDKRLVLVVPPDFKTPHELEDLLVVVDTDLPSQPELAEAYADIMDFVEGSAKKTGKSKKPDYSEEEISRILAAGAGMTVSEFETTVSRALRTFKDILPDVPIDDFVKLVGETKAEIIKRSDVLELMAMGKMSDVGGLENLKEWIAETALAYQPEARDFGVDRPKGVALGGPPGTGKSLCAKAIAHTLGLPLVRFDVSKVFAGLVGASETRMREALKLCDAMAPCVVMLDEVDKVFNVNQGGGDSGTSSRVMGTVLTHMQETPKPVFWVMTFNRVGGLPPEMLRKGRLDEVFSVTLPGEKERREILEIHLRKRKQDPKKIEGLEKAVERSAGFVGAEIEAAVSRAVLKAYASAGKKGKITADLICAQFDNSKPLAVAHAEQFSEMREWAEANAAPASKERPPETPRSSVNRDRTPRPTQAAASGMGKKTKGPNLDG